MVPFFVGMAIGAILTLFVLIVFVLVQYEKIKDDDDET